MNPYALVIDGITLPVTLHPDHEYTLTTTEVAAGYGVSKDTLKKTVRRHLDEMVEGKHWFSEVGTNCPHPGITEYGLRHWTKRGIVRLGFFIRSERAKRFRDMAEDLVIRAWEGERPQPRDLTGLSTADLIAIKIEEFQFGPHATMADFTAMLALHQRYASTPTPAERHAQDYSLILREIFHDIAEVRQEVERLSHIAPVHPEMPVRIEGDPFVEFLGRCFNRFGSEVFSLAELLMMGAPVDLETASPERALGRKLSPYLERRIRTPETPAPVTLHRKRTARARRYYFTAAPDPGAH